MPVAYSLHNRRGTEQKYSLQWLPRQNDSGFQLLRSTQPKEIPCQLCPPGHVVLCPTSSAASSRSHWAADGDRLAPRPHHCRCSPPLAGGLAGGLTHLGFVSESHFLLLSKSQKTADLLLMCSITTVRFLPLKSMFLWVHVPSRNAFVLHPLG